jgi:hypothetical protein
MEALQHLLAKGGWDYHVVLIQDHTIRYVEGLSVTPKWGSMWEVAGILWESQTVSMRECISWSACVACDIDYHEMEEISSASRLIDPNIADSTMSVMLTSALLDGDGWCDVASAARFTCLEGVQLQSARVVSSASV